MAIIIFQKLSSCFVSHQPFQNNIFYTNNSKNKKLIHYLYYNNNIDDQRVIYDLDII